MKMDEPRNNYLSNNADPERQTTRVFFHMQMLTLTI